MKITKLDTANHDPKSLINDFDNLYKEWHTPLVYFAFRYTDDKEAAIDIVQDSFIKIWQRRHGFNNIKAFKSYLYTIVRNGSLTWLMQEKKSALCNNELSRLHARSNESIFENTVRAEFVNEVCMAVSKLPPHCKKIYEMIYIDGKSPKEVATELNVSISTIKSQKARGLVLLRKMLASKLGTIVITFFLSWL